MPQDYYKGSKGLSQPADRVQVDTDFSQDVEYLTIPKSIHCLGAGNLVFSTVGDPTTTHSVPVVAGMIVYARVHTVFSTGTTVPAVMAYL